MKLAVGVAALLAIALGGAALRAAAMAPPAAPTAAAAPIAAAAPAAAAASTPPAPGPMRELRFPAFADQTLPNGLRLIQSSATASRR